MSVLLGKEQECEERLGYSDKAENAPQSIYNPLASGASPNGSAPQTDGLAHQKRVKKKGKLFSQNRNTFHLGSLIWVSDKTENASQSIYNPLASGALSSPQTPSPNGSAPRADGPAHQKKGKKKVNYFLETEILFIWNHSFRSQVRLRMHLRASSTLWLLGP